MSVPLDNLYNFLEDVVDQDIVIYRWAPHGSRNLNDLTLHRNITDFKKFIQSPVMICHDQEPLNYQYYKVNDVIDNVNNYRFQNNTLALSDKEKFLIKDGFEKTHLRMAVRPYIPTIYDYSLLLHSEKNSQELKKFINHWCVPVYYWSHALIARDWFRYAQIDPALKKSNVKYDFLIYNRAWSGTREYRLKFAELLVTNDLTGACLTSFNSIDQGCHYRQHQFSNSSLAINLDIDSFFQSNTYSSNASGDYAADDYQQCAVEIVLETLFDDSRWHLTEKILRPIACRKPFILAATPGSLEYLKSYGFKTFSPIIDESYDKITDPLQRLDAIITAMKKFSMADKHAKRSMLATMNEICKYNQQLFFSDNFQNNIVNEYVQNVTTGISKIKKSSKKHFLKTFLDHANIPPSYQILIESGRKILNLDP